MADVNLITMRNLVDQVLPFRTCQYLDDFCSRLIGEGIVAPSDLLLTTMQALETMLTTLASFNFIEVADVISLRSAVDRVINKDGGAKSARFACMRSLGARSRSHGKRRGRGRHRANSSNDGFRNNSRPHHGRDNGRDNREHGQCFRREKQIKPELWLAVEICDAVGVQQMLALGKDPEEKFEELHDRCSACLDE